MFALNKLLMKSFSLIIKQLKPLFKCVETSLLNQYLDKSKVNISQSIYFLEEYYPH